MVGVEFIEQLVNSMEDAVLKLEKAIAANKIDDANKLRTFIFDLYRQIDNAMMGK
jgi:hypothetical protein